MHHVWPYFFLIFVAATAAYADSTGQPVAPGTTSAPAPAPFADQLTGDWGRLRTGMAAHGVTLELESLHSSQGLLAGTGRHDFAYGGRLDAFLQVDTGTLGLWPGGVHRTHLEYRYGDLSPTLGGVALPTNVGVTLPAGTAWAVTSIHLAQRFGERVTLLLGKINTVDLLRGDPFFGGAGTSRFLNLAFAAPPTGLTPAVIMGGLLSVRTAPLTWTVMAYDPNDRTTDYGPEDLFREGVNVSLAVKYEGRLAGRTSSLTL